jgi:hypothetical protein
MAPLSEVRPRHVKKGQSRSFYFSLNAGLYLFSKVKASYKNIQQSGGGKFSPPPILLFQNKIYFGLIKISK